MTVYRVWQIVTPLGIEARGRAWVVIPVSPVMTDRRQVSLGAGRLLISLVCCFYQRKHSHVVLAESIAHYRKAL